MESDIKYQTVTEVTQQIKNLVEIEFPQVCVMGEISNCTRAGSGHVYLTLKDDSSQLRGVMWRTRASRLKFELHDGLEVVAIGPIEVYAARGSYQISIEQLLPRGVGPLELAFQQMQKKLVAEGLFDSAHKQPLPTFPRKIALITSPTSAAVRDMLQVLTRRWQATDILVFPVRVQGAGAAEEIATALKIVSNLSDIDLVITGRGGGSLEDLWAFNEEIVARAIFNCAVPVISAVGHEIDVTIADLVADCRALTPSEAAELAVPLQSEVIADIAFMQQRMTAALREQARRARELLNGLAARRPFLYPFEGLHAHMQKVDDLESRLKLAMKNSVSSIHQSLDKFAGSLDALSPLAVLKRGYSITSNVQRQQVLRNTADIKPGDKIQTQLCAGKIISKVETVVKE